MYIFLIQWSPAGRDLAAELRSGGWEVHVEAEDGGRAYRRIRADPPAAVVIDMTAKPSHGREVARSLRGTKATRTLPIVLVGDPARPDVADLADVRTVAADDLATTLAPLRPLDGPGAS